MVFSEKQQNNMPKFIKNQNELNIETAYTKALEVLDACAKTNTGAFYASGLPGGYEATWSRDSMITTLGAALIGERYREPIKKSLDILGKNQSYLGQIPNCVGSFNLDRQSDVTFNSIDSTLWYIIGLVVYSWRFGEKEFYIKHKKELTLGLIWLSYQDPDEVRMLVQQPTMDWMDAFPHKYGYVLNTQALYYGALRLIGKKRQAEHLKRVVNGQFHKYLSLYDSKLGYYWPWAWKNHDDKREHEEWFDSLGNCLAIITGLATPTIANNILKTIKERQINYPYPLRAIDPPLKPGGLEWKDYFANCDAREPYQYLNGGVWLFIGGFYVAALVKMKKFKEAEKELARLAEANLKVIKELNDDALADIAKQKKMNKSRLKNIRQQSFNEWLDGQTGEPKGEPYQAWSAGAYLYAYHCVKDKMVWYFDYE